MTESLFAERLKPVLQQNRPIPGFLPEPLEARQIFLGKADFAQTKRDLNLQAKNVEQAPLQMRSVVVGLHVFEQCRLLIERAPTAES